MRFSFSIGSSLFFGVSAVIVFSCAPFFAHGAAPRKLWIPCLQIPPCPADALKARKSQIFVLRHDLRKRQSSRIFQAALMLGDISGLEKISIVCGYTDMRKSIDGLCAVIEDQLKMDPSSSALFLFCGRRRDRIKALFREPDGFVLIYKRLSVRGGYQWPRKQSEVRNLSWREFDWLMSGIDIDQPKALKAE